jgi:hypothetical protein
VGRHAGFLVPSNQVNEEPALLKMIRNGERIEHYETARQRKDVEVSITVSPIRNASGEIIGISGIARDISDLKWSQEAHERRCAAQERIRQLSDRDREILSLLVAASPNSSASPSSPHSKCGTRISSLLTYCCR